MIFKIFEKSVAVSRSINLKHTKEKIWDLTPENIRLRKRYLTENERKRHSRGSAARG